MLIVAQIERLAGHFCLTVQTVLIMSAVISVHYLNLKPFFSTELKVQILTPGVELKLLPNT